MDSIIFSFDQIIRFAFKNHNDGTGNEIENRLRLLENEVKQTNPNIDNRRLTEAKVNYLDNLSQYINREKEKYENVSNRDHRMSLTFFAFCIIMVYIVAFTFPFKSLIINLRDNYPEDALYITASVLAYIILGILFYVAFRLANKKYLNDYSLKIDCLLDLDQVVVKYKSMLETEALLEEEEEVEERELRIENSVVENMIIQK